MNTWLQWNHFMIFVIRHSNRINNDCIRANILQWNEWSPTLAPILCLQNAACDKRTHFIWLIDWFETHVQISNQLLINCIVCVRLENKYGVKVSAGCLWSPIRGVVFQLCVVTVCIYMNVLTINCIGLDFNVWYQRCAMNKFKPNSLQNGQKHRVHCTCTKQFPSLSQKDFAKRKHKQKNEHNSNDNECNTSLSRQC